MPAPGSGNVIASVASAMPYTQNAVPASSPNGAPAPRNASTESGSIGSAPLSASRQAARSRSPLRRSARAASAYEKLGPPVTVQPNVDIQSSQRPGCGEEVLRAGEHEVDAGGHRHAEQPDEAHVVVQRQPRRDARRGRRRTRRRARIASMFAVTHRCGSITPLGSAVLPLVNCRIASDSGSTVGAAKRAGVADQLVEHRDGESRRARSRRAEGRRARSRRRRSRTRRRVASTNSSIEPSRIGSGSIATVAPVSHVAWIAVTSARDVGPSSPTVDAGPGAAGLERGGHGAGLVVELGPRDGLGRVGGTVGGAGDEGDGAAPVGGRGEPRGQRV